MIPSTSRKEYYYTAAINLLASRKGSHFAVELMIGVIADDLSGAAEIAAIGWRHALSAEIQIEPNPRSKADLIVIDTDSRLCNAKVAARKAHQAATFLNEQNAEWLYKKVDSVLRGQVLVELKAILTSSGKRRALLVPCNPSRGRTIRDGQYWIDDTLIHKTDFRNDPFHPIKSANVFTMLKSNSKQTFLRTIEQGLPNEGIVLGEATNKSAVETWAETVDPTIVPAGGADFFESILRQRGYKPRRHFSKQTSDKTARQLFICGSASASTQQFIKHCRVLGVPVLSMPPEVAGLINSSTEHFKRWIEHTVDSVERFSRTIVAIDRPLMQEPNAATFLGDKLIELAATVLKRAKVSELYIEGGATASQLVGKMKWKTLFIQGELAPGIVSMKTDENISPRVIIKPGSYSWPAALLK